MSDTREILIETVDPAAEFLIEIPSDWKVTFGPLSQQGYRDGTALRLYETENKQRACFVNVRSFRDLSIPVKRRAVRSEKSSRETRDNKGNSVFAEEISVDDGGWEDLND